MVARDSVAEMDTKELLIERVFDAPRERVFDAFTNAEHLQKWWGPKGVGIGATEFEARPGGKIFFAEHFAGGVNYIAGTVREIERPSRLVFAMHFANEKGERVSPPTHSALGAEWDGEIVSDVTFSAEGRRTRVTIRTPRSGVTAEWAKLARLGWGESLDKLDHAIADDMKVAPAGERDIVITRTFNAPRALVYEALTKAEHVKNWWGPRQYGAVEATG